ncbi:large ribosomal subunit protein bL20-like [Daphnia carinata]|uniref:large ribosomal subunit protein bL20-like n=1 Tax=Daphnia carinata TaxID=120202 RepID=UPI00257D9982|nr:large ribosomal subunit protein bL20-like [Daphnia carinata]
MLITRALFNRAPKADNFWKRRRVFKLTAHYRGRKRNCYSIAIKHVHRALVYVKKGRQLKKKDAIELWQQRISAGCRELGSSYEALVRGMARCQIALDKKTLANLAIWEPRTFKSLTQIAAAKLRQEPIKGLNDISPPPPGVMTRGML